MKINTSVFLLKKEFSSEDDVFINQDNVFDGNDCRIYIDSKRCKLPPWLNIVNELLPREQQKCINQSASSGAVIALKVNNRIMALSFAGGRFNIDQEKIESRFGLKSCLNLQTTNKFKNLRIQSLEANSVQKQESRASWTELDEFSINIENEMVKSVTGQIDSEYFGKNISGFDSLSIKIDFEKSNIHKICESLLNAYESENYKQKYDYIDKIFPVSDKSLISKLDSELFEKIKKRDEDVWMCIPDFINWENIEYFNYLDNSEKDDINIEDFYESIDNGKIKSAVDLKRKQITAYSSEGKCLYKKNAYYCTTAEVNIDGQSYILNNARWYSISQDLENDIKKLEIEIQNNCETNVMAGLPDCTFDKEGDYNKACAKQNVFDLWDCKLINNTEVCDLWSHKKEFIHVKKYSSSSLLSHLFNQGLVSATQMNQSRDYRSKVEAIGNRDNLFSAGKMFESVNSFKPQDYSVKFAIISKDINKFRLPRFSLISYRQTKKNIEDMGYKVGIIKIQKAQQDKHSDKNSFVKNQKHPCYLRKRKSKIQVMETVRQSLPQTKGFYRRSLEKGLKTTQRGAVAPLCVVFRQNSPFLPHNFPLNSTKDASHADIHPLDG